MAITGAPARIGAGLRILTLVKSGRRNSELFSDDDVVVSSSDSVFGFLEISEDSPQSSYSDGDGVQEEIGVFDDKEEGESSAIDLQAKKNFWENQHNLLQGALWRTTELETGIRNATKDALKEIEAEENHCKCGKVKVARNDCGVCLMREVSTRLREAGYNCAICRSNWRNSSHIPSGEHTYLDVVDNSSPKKGEVRVMIELNFRAEFEMARASQDYNELISRLPEVFVGKVERLRTLVKILCSAAKKCMKDKKIHMGPWRKHKYMQAKWFSNCKRLETDADVDLVFSKKAIEPSKDSRVTVVLLDVDVPCKDLSVM